MTNKDNEKWDKVRIGNVVVHFMFNLNFSWNIKFRIIFLLQLINCFIRNNLIE